MSTEITLSAGRHLFTQLGRKTASRWKEQQLANAFDNGLEALATEEALESVDADALETYTAWYESGDAGILIVDDTDTEEVVEKKPTKKAAKKKATSGGDKKPAKKATKKKAAKKKPAADEDAEPDDTDEDVEAVVPEEEEVVEKKPAKKAAKKKAAKKAAKKKAAEKKGIVIRGGATRPYFVGVVLEAHTVEGDIVPETITSEMVQEADDAYAEISGRSNIRETEFAMRNAAHAIRGYFGADTGVEE